VKGPDTSNHRKYTEGAENPVVGALLDRLFAAVARDLRALGPESLLDAGAGEGHALDRLSKVLPARVTAFDRNPDAVAFCAGRHPEARVEVQDIHELPYPDDAFDVVLCMEVLEHLDTPARALGELTRVARRALVLTVPFEPWFQLGNLVRGKYPETRGNHPEHVQHWGIAGFRAFLAREPGLEGIRVRPVGPWLVGTAQPAPSDPLASDPR
jgi:SAM-dependent methyltransferase